MTLSLALALAALLAPAQAPDAVPQAMLELRIFEARVPPAPGPEAIARTLPGLDTLQLDLDLMELEANPDLEKDLLGIAGVRKSRIVSAPRIVVQEGEDARIESGVHMDDRKTRPTLAADVRWTGDGTGLFLVRVRVDRMGEALEGEVFLHAGESVLLARREKGALLAAVVTLRPLVAEDAQ